VLVFKCSQVQVVFTMDSIYSDQDDAMQRVKDFYRWLTEKEHHINANISMMKVYVGTRREYEITRLQDENKEMQDQVSDEGLRVVNEYANEEWEWKQVKRRIERDTVFYESDEKKNGHLYQEYMRKADFSDARLHMIAQTMKEKFRKDRLDLSKRRFTLIKEFMTKRFGPLNSSWMSAKHVWRGFALIQEA